ncbi:flagellar brake protein [Shewanella sp. NIFS-20-20]|uniref:flagellar brake protein n=1 Tax=Shewanella sp. NIFS-20-20 TaxID=2853806 RepID=UPI001C48FEB5|nr:flagellar brake protein [Shewanella sp. NIFS-20-20]MBV7314496.1 flagellar brake protein [Shewanella sp. NIFS-20-20]
MSSQAETTASAPRVTPSETISGLHALEMIIQGDDAILDILTPLNKRLTLSTALIGSDKQEFLLFSLPHLTCQQRERFLYEGFRLVVTLVSERGDGARLRFVSRIKHIITQPLAMLVVELPSIMQMTPMRQENRFDLDMSAHIVMPNRKVEVQLKNMSVKGCRFSYDQIAPSFDVGAKINIEVISPTSGAFSLSGMLKNCRRYRGAAVYGMQFTAQTQEISRSLLNELVFDGQKMTFAQHVDASLLEA